MGEVLATGVNEGPGDAEALGQLGWREQFHHGQCDRRIASTREPVKMPIANAKSNGWNGVFVSHRIAATTNAPTTITPIRAAKFTAAAPRVPARRGPRVGRHHRHEVGGRTPQKEGRL
jgi:hypothetical protein